MTILQEFELCHHFNDVVAICVEPGLNLDILSPILRVLFGVFMFNIHMTLDLASAHLLLTRRAHRLPSLSVLVHCFFQHPRYIPVALYPKHYKRAYGVQTGYSRPSSPIFQMKRLFGPHLYPGGNYTLFAFSRLGPSNGHQPIAWLTTTTGDSILSRIVICFATWIAASSFCSFIGALLPKNDHVGLSIFLKCTSRYTWVQVVQSLASSGRIRTNFEPAGLLLVIQGGSQPEL